MDNLTLIGIPGSGKSTLGKMLAEKLCYEFIDCDKIIESGGRKLQDIIDKEGDDGFMKIEEKVLLDLDSKNKVFSPGGSCILYPKAMEHLRNISLVVFIDIPFELVKEWLEKGDMHKRGIVGLKKMSIKELYEFRRPLYLKYAHVTINFEKDSIKENFDILLKEIHKFK